MNGEDPGPARIRSRRPLESFPASDPLAWISQSAGAPSPTGWPTNGYRLHGPSLVIEYDNAQNDANHIHSVWHNPTREVGGDLLRRHYDHPGHGHEHRK